MHCIFVLLWACTYGVVAGVLYAFLALGEYVLHAYRSLSVEWKKHPERLQRKLLIASGKSWSVFAAVFTDTGTMPEQTGGYTFFPLLLFPAMLCLALILLPVYLVKGILYGPLFILKEGMVFQ